MLIFYSSEGIVRFPSFKWLGPQRLEVDAELFDAQSLYNLAEGLRRSRLLAVSFTLLHVNFLIHEVLAG